MASCIVYTDPAGNVCVIDPAPHLNKPELLDWVATETLAKAGLPPTLYEIVDHTELPPRRFRGAWKRDGKAVVVDIDAAKQIRVAELEREKATLVKASIADHMLALVMRDDAYAEETRQKVRALNALDKTALAASVASAEDLDDLAQHEPDAIKNAKVTKVVIADDIASITSRSIER